MKKPRSLSSADRSVRIMVLAHLSWLALICFLGAWWGKLLLSQARKIAELEGSLGMAADVTQNHWHRTQRMLYWESLTFFGLLLTATGLLFYLYWRDLRRARGVQAFFAAVTHELRTPLTSVRLQAESIADNLAEDPSQRPLIQRLLEDTIRLEAQVERTLELARVEGGGPVYTQPLPIKEWLDRFLKSWTADYVGRVEFESCVEDVVIEADPTAIEIIFKNIFENSVRHSQKDRVRIQISSHPQSAGVVVALRDDGRGYSGSPAGLGVLFQRGPASRGTGVGLYLVKVLMKRMKGAVDFTSLNSGFEVSLWFPSGRQHG